MTTTHELTALAFELADGAARSDIELLCICATVDAGGRLWFDPDKPPETGHTDDDDRDTIARAMKYLELRQMLERRGALIAIKEAA